MVCKPTQQQSHLEFGKNGTKFSRINMYKQKFYKSMVLFKLFRIKQFQHYSQQSEIDKHFQQIFQQFYSTSKLKTHQNQKLDISATKLAKLPTRQTGLTSLNSSKSSHSKQYTTSSQRFIPT